MRVVYLIIITLLFSLCSKAQDITVKAIVFTETVDHSYKSNIPFVIDNTGHKSEVVTKINDAILDRFMIESFDTSEVSEFRWYDVAFESEIKANLLLISFYGEYYGAYPNQIEDHLYFDLSTGTQLPEKLLAFNTFFSLKGYFSFFDKYLIEDCKREFDIAIECAEFDPYCDYYDMDISFSEKDVTFSLTDDCYPHVVRACAPGCGAIVQKDSLKPYLNEFGEYILFKTSYSKMTRLEKFIFYRENYSKIPNFYFIVGSIDSKYPFSMAIELNEKNKKVSGYYYYDKQHKPIILNGQFDQSKIILTESVNKKTTGRFDFTWHSEYEKDGIYLTDGSYWSGNWFDTSGKQSKVNLKDIKANR